MKTQRTISNISYNTADFFSQKMKDWESRGVIDWAYWIYHKADIDELKDHIHFVLKPSSRVDTSALRNDLNEFDPCCDLPLTCTSKWHFVSSMDDWLLYAVHDTGYLASKGQRRNIRYEYDDIKATDFDALRNDWNSIDRAKFDRLRRISEAVENGVPFVTLVQEGIIPISLRAQYQFQYQDLARLKYLDVSARVIQHEEDMKNDKPQEYYHVDDSGEIHEDMVRADEIPF